MYATVVSYLACECDDFGRDLFKTVHVVVTVFDYLVGLFTFKVYWFRMSFIKQIRGGGQLLLYVGLVLVSATLWPHIYQFLSF